MPEAKGTSERGLIAVHSGDLVHVSDHLTATLHLVLPDGPVMAGDGPDGTSSPVHANGEAVAKRGIEILKASDESDLTLW